MSGTRPENKIFFRHYGFNNYYAVDRKLPDILDRKHNAKWQEYCDKFDMTFKYMNILQSVVFQCKLAILVVTIFYVFMIAIVYEFPPPLLIFYVLAGLVVFTIALNIVVQGPMNKKCVGEAMAFIKEENEKRTIQTISGSAVEVSLVHHKLNWLGSWVIWFNWDGYEYDSEDCQRHASIYIELHSVGNIGNDSSTGYNYTNVTTKSTGNNYTNVKTDAENPPFATVASAYVSTNNAKTDASAYVSTKVAPTNNAKTNAKTVASAYVSTKAAPTKSAGYDLANQIEQEKGQRLAPYVSVPMAKATIVDTPTMPPATKVEEDLPSAYVTKK